jgi:hypothetical protein
MRLPALWSTLMGSNGAPPARLHRGHMGRPPCCVYNAILGCAPTERPLAREAAPFDPQSIAVVVNE